MTFNEFRYVLIVVLVAIYVAAWIIRRRNR